MIALFAAALAVFLIYLLRPPATKVLVPSTLLWNQLVEQSAHRRRLVRWLLSLLLSMLILLLLVSVLLRLEPRAGTIRNPILLLDNTGSMATLLDGGSEQTRLDLAKRRALEILDHSTGTITVADLAATVGPSRFHNIADARTAILSIETSSVATPRIPDYLVATERGPLSESGPPVASVYLFTDRPQKIAEAVSPVVDAPPSPSSVSALRSGAITVVNVSRPATNLGIVRFSLAKPDPNILDRPPASAYLEIVNGGDQTETGVLELAVFPLDEILEQATQPKDPLLRREFSIAVGASWSAALDLMSARAAYPDQAIAVRATVERTQDAQPLGDQQPLDDQAWLVINSGTTEVLLGNAGTKLPRWFTRILATSSSLTEGSSQFKTKHAISIYRQLPENPRTPCMLLPPRVDPDSPKVAVIDLQRVVLTLPNSPPLRLPWNQLLSPPETVLTKRASDHGTNAWLIGQLATTPSASLSDSAPGTSRDPLEQNREVVLLAAQTESSPCVTWSFDPLASQLETRSEFPILIERVLIAAAENHQRLERGKALSDDDRELVAGSWHTASTSGASAPQSKSTLHLHNGELTASRPPGLATTLVSTTALDLQPPHPNQRRAARSALPPPTADTSLNNGENSKSWLRWPSRIELVSLIVLLLLAEVSLRFLGVTE